MAATLPGPAVDLPTFDGFDWPGELQVCQAFRSEPLLAWLGAERLRFDRLQHRPTLGGAPCDRVDVERLREGFARYCALRGRPHWHGTAPSVERALLIVARERPVHPVAEHLAALTWDGTPRLGRVAEEVLGVSASAAPFASQLLRRWFVGAVARAFQPGCRVDSVLTLVGCIRPPADLFFRVLVPPALYLDAPAPLGSVEGRAQLRRAWVCGRNDLEALIERSPAAFATFLSTTDDLVDNPFALTGERAPRTTLFVAALKTLPPVRDAALRRRLWVVHVGSRLDAGKLAAWREQLWAEAVDEFRRGLAWDLTPAEEEQLLATHETVSEQDPLVDRLTNFLAQAARTAGVELRKLHLTMDEILEGALGLKPSERTAKVQRDVGTALREAGFEPCRQRRSGARRSEWRLVTKAEGGQGGRVAGAKETLAQEASQT